MNYIIEGGFEKSRLQRASSLGTPITIFRNETNGKDKNIGIDSIRELKKELSLKQMDEKLIYIPNADSLTIPAQNAFLKLLEEPPPKTYFCLSVRNLSTLLPTIVSRTAILKLKQENGIDANSDTIRSAGELLRAYGQGFAGVINFKNKIKKELKEGDGTKYFSLSLAILRDTLLLRLNLGNHVTFKSLSLKIEETFKDLSLLNIRKALERGIHYYDLLESGHIGGDKLLSAFLLETVCTPKTN